MSVFNSVKSPSVVRLNGIVIQQSTYGIPLPIGWGTNRIGASLIWYNAFKAQAIKQSSGKGGGSTTTGYNYSASVIMAIADGPITGVRNVYKDQNVYIPGAKTGRAQAGLSLQVGSQGQATWGYLTTNYSAQAIGYSRTAYAYASNYALSTSATLANHSFEVQWATRAVVSGSTIDDANPADILLDFLTNAYYGVPLWGSGLVASLTTYSNYCTAAGLFVSPGLASTQSAAQFITDLLDASNSDCVWSNGQLKVVPLGDTAITNNGVTYTPNLTPVYAFTEDDFIPQSDGDDPVTIDLAKLADAYNSVQIGFSDRSLNYNQNTAQADDMGSIATYGARRENMHSLPMICDANVAAAVAQLRVQRLSNLRRTFKFSLDWRYCLLEPLDLVTLTTGDLSAVLVRINEIKENADGGLDIVAEEMLVGTSHAAVYTRQTASGTIINTSIAPGSVSSPVLINPARSLTNNDLQAWVAVSGGANWGGCQVFTSVDGTNYQYAGALTTPARYGVTTSTLGSVADPDTFSSFGVDLTASLGTLNTATAADANAASTLCLIGSELISYQAATLTSANHYTLGTLLRRGLMGTSVGAHSTGSQFVRLDGGIFKYSYTPQQVGKTIYVKICSFNIYGQALEDISTVTAYSLTLSAAASIITFGTLTGVPANVAALTGSEAIQNSILQSSLTSGSVVPAVSSAVTGQGQWATYTSLTPAQVVFPGVNIVYDGGLTLKGQNWSIGSGWTISFDSGVGYFAGTSGPISTATNLVSPQFICITGQPYTLSLNWGGKTNSGAFTASAYIDWHNSSGVSLGTPTSSINPVMDAGYNTASVTGTAPGSAAYGVVVVKLTNMVTGAYFIARQIKVEIGSVATPFNDAATNGALYQTGQTIDALQPAQAGADVTLTNIPPNTNLATAYTYNPVSPCTGSTSSTLTMVACTVTTPSGSYSLPSGTISGLSASTQYAIFYDRTGATYVAVATSTTPYFASTRYIFMTTASTTASGSGGGGGGGGGGGLPFCCAPETPVLTSSMDEIPAGDLVPGVQICTEHEHTGEWGDFTVEAVKRVEGEPRLVVTFEDGRTVVCTPSHLFGADRGGFVAASELAPGVRIRGARPGVVCAVELAQPGPVMVITVSAAHTYQTAGLTSHNKIQP